MFRYVQHEMLVNVRERSNLSQKAVACRVGVSPATLSRWETGERIPSEKHLPGLCRGLGCSVFDLWDEEKRLQELFYREQAALRGETVPVSSTSPIGREMAMLLALEKTAVPVPAADVLAAQRNTLTVLLTLVEPLVSQQVGLHRALRALKENEPESELLLTP